MLSICPFLDPFAVEARSRAPLTTPEKAWESPSGPATGVRHPRSTMCGRICSREAARRPYPQSAPSGPPLSRPLGTHTNPLGAACLLPAACLMAVSSRDKSWNEGTTGELAPAPQPEFAAPFGYAFLRLRTAPALRFAAAVRRLLYPNVCRSLAPAPTTGSSQPVPNSPVFVGRTTASPLRFFGARRFKPFALMARFPGRRPGLLFLPR